MFGFGSAKSSKVSNKSSAAHLPLEQVVDTYADAAAVLRQDASVIVANPQADAFLDLLVKGPENPILKVVRRTIDQGRSVTERIMVRAEEENLVYQVNTLPLELTDGASGVLVLARDMTADRNIVDALVASRELFKDLVACSSDFAWETDQEGRFTYVSKEGALGFLPADLVGQSSRVLKCDEDDRSFPFDSRQPMEDHEVWLRTAEAGKAFCRVSSRPVIKDGQLIAVRGVSRDITDEFLREAELERRRMQEKLLQRIVDALRTEFDTQRLLNTAATLPTQVLNSDACWVFMADEGTDYLRIHMQYPVDDPEMAILAEELVQKALKMDELILPVEAEARGRSLIADVTKFRDRVNGAIVMSRGADVPGWTEDERQLIASVAAHLGIAFHQINERETLERLSRLDEVTGLKNRRAFMEELDQRLAHMRRFSRSGVLAYVDMDNFKAVNDVLGHSTGDTVLRRMASILEENNRAGDLAARIGGDEFVVWLEETDLEGASQWANRVISTCGYIRDITKGETPDVTVSIGLAAFEKNDPSDMAGLMQRADTAMYEAKNSGKAAYRIAPSSVPS